ncbi:DNA-processing protein DprA [Mycobacterium sp. 134]|uniref:DNA-processing protein DprA n=1 Tax=Mycobacterium sp. 134 TaxID=3400425 RepID=UPI003AB04542
MRFVARNRLIAASSAATVVVESGLRGGATNTARWARHWGRQLGAGPVRSPGSVARVSRASATATLGQHSGASGRTDGHACR